MKIAEKNTYPHLESYLGFGAYSHYIPALCSKITEKSEFLTSYTPYQPEISQGGLQSIFDFQTAISTLTGMNCANASVYDGASACAESCLMALRYDKTRSQIIVAANLHPFYKACIDQYLKRHPVEIVEAPLKSDGTLDFEAFKRTLSTKTACVLLQSPNVFGQIEDVAPFFEEAKKMSALSILAANPLSYGLFATAGELGADIAVGDCQPFGNALNFGGPFVGYMACTMQLMRQLPGRLVGQTKDSSGKTGYVLTLQAREQHIRREKATSNICTNQALGALGALVALLWYGKEGVHELALTNYQRAAYLKTHLSKIPGITVDHGEHFNEFAAHFSAPIQSVLSHFRKEGIEPGLSLGPYFKERQNSLLIAVTELKSKEKLDRYLEVAKGACT